MSADLKTWWASAQWHADAEEWVNRTIDGFGWRRTAAIEQPRIRFWSTQLVVETDHGRLWFKENNPGQSFEASLLGVLAAIGPDHVVPPLAIDHNRGWLLNSDQGKTVAELGGTDEQLWTRIVRDFARLQRSVERSRDDLRAVGLSELPPGQASEFVSNVVERAAALPDSNPRRIDGEFAADVRARLPHIAEHGARLAAGPVPLSLDHNDLHHNNVFEPHGADDPLRFFDFGDALWAHPFCSMRIVINVLWHEWETTDDDPRFGRILDAYLDAWTDLAPRAELRDLMRSALSIGLVHRIASWDRVLPFADDEGLAEFGNAPAAWMGMLLKPDLEPWAD